MSDDKTEVTEQYRLESKALLMLTISNALQRAAQLAVAIRVPEETFMKTAEEAFRIAGHDLQKVTQTLIHETQFKMAK